MKFETIRQTVTVDATPIQVYEAYVDPKKQSEFTGESATGTPRAGGKFTASDGYIEGTHLKLVKGKTILQEWKTSEWPEGYPPSLLKLTFRAKGQKTEMTMVHSKVPAEQAARYAEGWKDYYWEPLKRFFAEG